jgi:hypothetical protein
MKPESGGSEEVKEGVVEDEQKTRAPESNEMNRQEKRSLKPARKRLGGWKHL